MKYNMIVEIDGGIVTGIYTDNPESFIVKITDPDDSFDPERKKERSKLESLINSGSLVNIMEESIGETETKI